MIQNWLNNLFGNKKLLETKEWRTDNSIFKFLSSQVDENGKLSESASDLPDEEKDEGQIRFAPGLMDAMFGEEESKESEERIAALKELLGKIASKGCLKSEWDFYQLITAHEGVIGIIDHFLEAVVHDALPVEPYLFSYAKDLATKTEKRNAVKFGIAMLGLCQNKSVLNDIKILGLHDEFAIYASVAILLLSDQPANDLWDLAKKVDGWGRIRLVGILSTVELSEPIRAWLVYEGYKNSIMHEYLAYTCAVHGELHKRLDADVISQELLESAASIIVALLVEYSPTEDITTYSFAAQVIQDFIRHAHTQAVSVSDFNTLHHIKDFLTGLHRDIGEQKENGWTQDIIANCQIEIVAILNSKDWTAAVHEGLRSKDNVVYWNAKKAAEKLGIDLWDTVWEKLQEKPLNSASWYDVTLYSKQEHSSTIIDFALLHLPFDELGTGAKDSHGIGDDYDKHASLEYVTTFLENYPKMGEKIILTALKSPVTRNRNMAILVLDKWRKENWSLAIDREIRYLSKVEPNRNTKDNIKRLLDGHVLK